MKTQPTIEIGTVSAKFTWRLHEHHGWTTIHSDYCSSRSEWDQSCDNVIRRAAHDSQYSPGLFTRAEFVSLSDAALAPETTHVLWLNHREFTQFASEAVAEAAYDAAMREHGLECLTCDRGGHAGITERVSVEDVTITVYIRGERYKFDADDADHMFTADEVFSAMGGAEDDDPEGNAQMRAESEIVANALNAALDDLRE